MMFVIIVAIKVIGLKSAKGKKKLENFKKGTNKHY